MKENNEDNIQLWFESKPNTLAARLQGVKWLQRYHIQHFSKVPALMEHLTENDSFNHVSKWYEHSKWNKMLHFIVRFVRKFYVEYSFTLVRFSSTQCFLIVPILISWLLSVIFPTIIIIIEPSRLSRTTIRKLLLSFRSITTLLGDLREFFPSSLSKTFLFVFSLYSALAPLRMYPCVPTVQEYFQLIAASILHTLVCHCQLIILIPSLPSIKGSTQCVPL